MMNHLVDLTYDDIPEEIFKSINAQGAVALDLETSGLDWEKEKIASVQVYCKNKPIVIVRINGSKPSRLIKIVEDPNITKVFHYAIFDLRFIFTKWGILGKNIACTKTASRLLDPTNEQKHSLRSLVKRYLDIELDKEEQTSNWLSVNLTESQIEYAAKDVLYLHDLLDILKQELEKRSLWNIAQSCFTYIPTRVFLDVNGYPDIYLHS